MEDKLKHVVWGMTFFLIGWGIWNVKVGVLCALGIGFLKELNDVWLFLPFLKTSDKRFFDVKDLFATILFPLIFWGLYSVIAT